MINYNLQLGLNVLKPPIQCQHESESVRNRKNAKKKQKCIRFNAVALVNRNSRLVILFASRAISGSTISLRHFNQVALEDRTVVLRILTLISKALFFCETETPNNVYSQICLNLKIKEPNVNTLSCFILFSHLSLRCSPLSRADSLIIVIVITASLSSSSSSTSSLIRLLTVSSPSSRHNCRHHITVIMVLIIGTIAVFNAVIDFNIVCVINITITVPIVSIIIPGLAVDADLV